MPACALLLAAYLVMSLFNDPRGYLGTDTGGKVATLEVMEERGDLDPDVGYWAERWDPGGQLHPLYYTSHVGHRWVNVTTLPMLYAGYPLYRLGGYRLTLLLPMLGSVLAALAARALARRFGAGDDGWLAFWLVGLASPLRIYALDFWEHSLGVAGAAWAFVLLIDLVEQRRGWPAAGVAGLLLGAAATLRTESLVYGLVGVGGACLLLLFRHRKPLLAFGAGAAASVGLAVPLLANLVLEKAALSSDFRVDRATNTASAVGEAAGKRVEEALLNAWAITPAHRTSSYVVGAALLAVLVFAATRATRPATAGPAAVAFCGAAAFYLIRFALGPGFVPGLVAATPIAAAGLALGWRTLGARYALAAGLAALPLVWATQFQGGAAPQWAGRYLLVSGLLFGVAGIVAFPRLQQWARLVFAGLAVVVTVFGVVWTAERTHVVGRAMDELAARPEPVLVSRIGHLAREGGAFYLDHRWLTAPTDEEQQQAVEVLQRAGIDRFALVTLKRDSDPDDTVDPPPAGWRMVGQERIGYLSGLDLLLTTYAPR